MGECDRVGCLYCEVTASDGVYSARTAAQAALMANLGESYFVPVAAKFLNAEIVQVRISTPCSACCRKASFLNQGLLPQVDADGSETSDCASSVTSVTASNSPYDHADFMRNPMTFDALWRANLAQE